MHVSVFALFLCAGLVLGVPVDYSEQKQAVIDELKSKFAQFREDCFPRPSGGCTCNEKDENGNTVVKKYDNIDECNVQKSKRDTDYATQKQAVINELKSKFAQLREDCFPRPSGGCTCNEKDENGNTVVKKYDNINECNVQKSKRDTYAVQKHAAMINELKSRFASLRENCFPRPTGGCACNERDENGKEVVKRYHNIDECNVPRAKRATGVVNELNAKFAQFREDCFPRPSGGCTCNERDENGNEVVKKYDSIDECNVSRAKRATAVVEELNAKFAQFRENCFPRPSGGCTCSERDENGNEVVKKYDTIDECNVSRAKRATAVVEELNAKFAQFRENCFPRPSGGCTCSERDENDNEVLKKYDNIDECNVPRAKRASPVVEELNAKFGQFKENCYPKPSGGCVCNERDESGKNVVKKYDTIDECNVSRPKRAVSTTSVSMIPLKIPKHIGLDMRRRLKLNA